jgi:hypothetical protein
MDIKGRNLRIIVIQLNDKFGHSNHPKYAISGFLPLNVCVSQRGRQN